MYNKRKRKYPRIPENLIQFDSQSGICGGKIPGRNKLTIRQRLFLYMEKEEKENGCWNWTGDLDTSGRGLFGVKNHLYNTYRVVYAMYHPEFNPTQKLSNLCGNKKCVNPDHYVVEEEGNSFFYMDFREHPFYNKTNGIFITWKEFKKIKNDIIRKLYATEKYSLKDLGEVFDLDFTTVCHIINKTSNYGKDQ